MNRKMTNSVLNKKVNMAQLLFKTAFKISTFINVFFISFFMTFLIAHVIHAYTPLQKPPEMVRIVVDLKNLELIILKDNLPQKTFPVAIGKPDTPSPVGDWEIVRK